MSSTIVNAAKAAWPYIVRFGKAIGKIVGPVLAAEGIRILREYLENKNNPDSSDATVE